MTSLEEGCLPTTKPPVMIRTRPSRRSTRQPESVTCLHHRRPADEQRKGSDSLITHDQHDQTPSLHATLAEGSTVLMSNAEIFNQLSTLVNTIGSMAARVENIERETRTFQNNYEQQAIESGQPRPATQNQHRPGKEPVIEQTPSKESLGGNISLPQGTRTVQEGSEP